MLTLPEAYRFAEFTDPGGAPFSFEVGVDGNKDDFFFENGVYNGEANLVTEYGGDICYVSGGRVDTDFAGLADYAGTKYLFHHGRADLTYTGWYETDGTVYTIEKGVVTGQS